MKKCLFFVCFIICASFTFTSCQKDDNEIIGNNKEKTLLSNSDVSAMLKELSNFNITATNDGILKISSEEDLNRILDILQKYYDIYQPMDSLFDEKAILEAFDIHYKFTSLRSVLDEQIAVLENKESLFDYNDPDNHYIVSDFLRTLLTPHCEIYINNLLYVFFDGYIVGIMNNSKDSRTHLLELMDKVYTKADIYYFCSNDINAFILSEDDVRLNVNFAYELGENNTILFQNMTSCEKYENVQYFWEFGDGTTSNLKNPTHSYSTAGSKQVKLTAQYNGKNIISIKKVNTDACCANFTYEREYDGTYYFTSKSVVETGSAITLYEWDFGDGHSETTQTPNVTHYYSFNMTCTVRLTIHTDGQCEDYCEQQIKIIVKDGCYANPSNNNRFFVFGNKYVKTSIHVLNMPFIHRISSKTVFQEKRNNNSYKNVKADDIDAGAGGTLYFINNNDFEEDECGEPQFFSRYKDNRQHNKRMAIFSFGFGSHRKFRVGEKTLGAKYYVNKNSQVADGIGALVHE